MAATDRLMGVESSVAIKAPCRVATTAAISLSGLQTIDGVTLADGDRVLVKNQSNHVEHGIYTARLADWYRASDFDGSRDAVGGTRVIVATGTVNGGTIYATTGYGPITIGTDAITFALLPDGQDGTDGASFADQARTDGEVWGVTIPPDATDDEVLELLRGAFPPTSLTEIFQTTYGVWLLTDLAGISSPAEGETVVVAGDSGTDYLDPVSGSGPYANSGKYQVIGGAWTKVRTLNQARRDIDFGTWQGGYLDGQGVLSPVKRPAVLETATLDGVDGSLFADYRGRLLTTTNLNPGTLLDYTKVNGSDWESSDFNRFRRMYGADGGFFAFKPGVSGQFGLYSGIDTVSGEVAPFMFIDWTNAAHKGPADTASVIEVNWGNGTAGRVHNVTQGAYVISAKSYEREVQPASGGEVVERFYQSASADGATYRISNNAQTPGAYAGISLSVPMMGIVGGTDNDYLLTLGRHAAGVLQTPKWYVMGSGRQVVPLIDLPEQTSPGDPAADTIRIYSKDVGGVSKFVYRDSAGTETLLAGLASPSFTGTVTTEAFALTKSQNDYTTVNITNANAGSDALAGFKLVNDSGGISLFVVTSAAFDGNADYGALTGYTNTMWIDAAFELDGGIKMVARNGAVRLLSGGRSSAELGLCIDQDLRLRIGGETNSFPSLSSVSVSGGMGMQLKPAADTNGQAIAWKELTELTTIAAAATTDTTIQIPANVLVLGVSVRTTVAIPTATTYTVTGASSGTVFNTGANVSTAANTTNKGNAAGSYFNSTAQSVRITPNSTPASNTGRVRVVIWYIDITPPTS